MAAAMRHATIRLPLADGSAQLTYLSKRLDRPWELKGIPPIVRGRYSQPISLNAYPEFQIFVR